MELKKEIKGGKFLSLNGKGKVGNFCYKKGEEKEIVPQKTKLREERVSGMQKSSKKKNVEQQWCKREKKWRRKGKMKWPKKLDLENWKTVGNSKVYRTKHWYPPLRVRHMATTRTTLSLHLKCGHNQNVKSHIQAKRPSIFLRSSSHVRMILE